MMKYNSTQILRQLIIDVENIIKTVNTDFITLDNDKLHKQTTPNSWSANHYLQHLNSTGYNYLPQLKNAIENSICNCQYPKEFYHSGWIADKIIKKTKPQKNGTIAIPIKTFKTTFDPIKANYASTSAIPEFLEQQKKMLHYLRQAKYVNLECNKINSLLPILRFRLGDAFRFLIAHEQRHIQQAKNILKLTKQKI